MLRRTSLVFYSKFRRHSSSEHLPSSSIFSSTSSGVRLLTLSHFHLRCSSSSIPNLNSPSSFPKPNGLSSSSVSFSDSAVDLSSLLSASASKTKEVMSLTRHYGQCYWELSKARLSLLVVGTSGTGFVLGSGNAIDVSGLCCTCIGTMMVASSANSFNQVFEKSNDAKMNRTMQRPLPSGRITKAHAITWASSVGLTGTALLATQANMLAAGLAAFNLVLYALVYTPLKQIHPVNTWVGAVVGAIPPLLGWAGAAGDISLNAMILAAALYFWQIPHFMALAYLCRDDYAAGGFKMYSLADESGKRTASVALRNSLYLMPLGFLAYDWGVTSGWFCLESSVLTLGIIATAFSFYRDRTREKARRMFHVSLLYLPVFMSGLLIHRTNNQQLMVENTSLVELSACTKISVQEGENHNRKIKMRHPTGEKQAQPPVAYASVAPFPFLPAPSYNDY